MRLRSFQRLILASAFVLLTSLFSFVAQYPAHAQMFGTHHARRTAVTSVDVAVSPSSLKAGSSATLIVTVHLADGFHINASKTSSPMWIPTVLALNQAKYITFGKPVYPTAKSVKEPYNDKPLLVYTGLPVIRVPIKVGRGAKMGAHAISGSLSYQGCNDSICLPYGTKPISATITVK